MVDIDQWMKQYQDAVCGSSSAAAILFIGLQGSYGRNEAHETSDIDVVLILDAVSLH
jgi:predicted nucleotidyltransferase